MTKLTKLRLLDMWHYCEVCVNKIKFKKSQIDTCVDFNIVWSN